MSTHYMTALYDQARRQIREPAVDVATASERLRSCVQSLEQHYISLDRLHQAHLDVTNEAEREHFDHPIGKLLFEIEVIKDNIEMVRSVVEMFGKSLEDHTKHMDRVWQRLNSASQ